MNYLYELASLLKASPKFCAWSERFISVWSFDFLSLLAFLTVVVGLIGLLLPLRRPTETEPSVDLPRFPAIGYVYLLLAGLFSVAWRLCFAPHVPQVYFDEINIYGLAQNLAQTACFHIYPIHELGAKIIPIPPAWSYVLSVPFRLWGNSYAVISAVCLTLGCLTPLAAFWCGWRLWHRLEGAVLFSLLLAVLPLHLRMSGSGALESGTLLWLLLLMGCLLSWRDTRQSYWLWSAGVAASWLMNWRMENPVVVVPLLMVTLIIADSSYLKLLRLKEAFLVAAVSVLFALPGIVCDVYGMAQGYYLFYDKMEVLQASIASNAVNNWLFWFDNRFHPLWLTLAAGLGLLVWRPRRQALAWGFWFIVLNRFYAGIPSADFGLHHTIDSWRNAILPSLALIVLTCAGLLWVYDTVLTRLRRGKVTDDESVRERRFAVSVRPVFLLLASLLAVATALSFADFVRAKNTWISEFEFIQAVARRLPSQVQLLVDSNPFTLSNSESRTLCLGYASQCEWKEVFVLDEAFNRPGIGASPQLLRDIELWKEQKQRVFLYYLSVREHEWDQKRWQWLTSYLDLRLVAGVGDTGTQISFSLYEVDGLKAEGYKWLHSPEQPLFP